MIGLNKSIALQKKKGQIDYLILALVIIIVAFGLIMLFSSSYIVGVKRNNNGFYYVFGQLRGIIGGFIILAILASSKFNYKILKKYSGLIYIISVVALLLVYVPGLSMTAADGGSINGADRWFRIFGMSVQPSEIAKFGLIITVSAVISRFGQLRMQSFWKGVFPIIMLMSVIEIIILLQPNFSIFTIIAITCFAILMFSGVKWSHLVIMLILAIVAGGVIMFGEDYRSSRVASFMNPFDPALDKDKVLQIKQSLYAISEGGLFGKGVGNSTQKNMFLPLNESDFIFAIIAEEIGFFGSVIFLFTYLMLIWRCLRVAWMCNDFFGRLVAAGITTIIGLQVFINIGVVTSSIPNTGVPLPFVSYGSTSMIVFLSAIGIILNISRTINDP